MVTIYKKEDPGCNTKRYRSIRNIRDNKSGNINLNNSNKAENESWMNVGYLEKLNSDDFINLENPTLNKFIDEFKKQFPNQDLIDKNAKISSILIKRVKDDLIDAISKDHYSNEDYFFIVRHAILAVEKRNEIKNFILYQFYKRKTSNMGFLENWNVSSQLIDNLCRELEYITRG